MATLREVKKRIRTVISTRRTTKAMEMAAESSWVKPKEAAKKFKEQFKA